MNYQKILDNTIQEISKNKIIPKLLLHSCCAPCSSYVLEYLSQYFDIIVFYYNPNIHPESEYQKRVKEQKEFIEKFSTYKEVKFIAGEYIPQKFFKIVKGLEKEKEGGERCFRCYELRLRETAKKAKELNCNYFTTTLSISPHKNAQKINEIGEKLSEIFHINFLYADFKKRNGYKRSIELSKTYDLYRQDYCGCIYSKAERKEKKKNTY